MEIGVIFNLLKFVFFFVIGILSLKLTQEQYESLDSTAKSQKSIFKMLMNKFMKPLRISKRLIGKSIEKNSTISFGLSLFVLFLYYYIIGGIFYIIKFIFYLLIGKAAKPNFIEAFALLLGAGIMAFILWIGKIKEKSLSEDYKRFKVVQNLGQTFILFLVLLFWIVSELILLFLSPDISLIEGTLKISTFTIIYLVFMAIFMLFVVFSLLRYGVTNIIAKIIIIVGFLPIFAITFISLILPVFFKLGA